METPTGREISEGKGEQATQLTEGVWSTLGPTTQVSVLMWPANALSVPKYQPKLRVLSGGAIVDVQQLMLVLIGLGLTGELGARPGPIMAVWLISDTGFRGKYCWIAHAVHE
jgi:hypothetical protein